MLLLLLTLSRSGFAYEDPTAEASRQQERQFKPQLEAFRREYREAFPLHLDLYPKPKEHTVLFVYPDSIHRPFRDLLQNGLEKPASRVLQRLERLHVETKKTLLSSFHPDMIERQPSPVRNQHLDTFIALTAWMSEEQSQLVDHVGRRNVDLHLGFFRKVRDLATIATAMPTPPTFSSPHYICNDFIAKCGIQPPFLEPLPPRLTTHLSPNKPVMNFSIFQAVLAASWAMCVVASAPRCTFRFTEDGLQAPYGCPHNEGWTHCCLVPYSRYNAAHPEYSTYTGVCQIDPYIPPGSTDICKRLADRNIIQ
ncbi:hypothetical protein PANT_22c00145 [Moesziomyces antarcticus T-34]|uniref:Uncharacterized protein n=1 Tax=Pseudozyma antarctica (strain T-34) TaxID=1151754 RepID=M9LZX0_PSEA3|nr:hypothetical protein PANT_22c00145 [Moesziomyces antarcticus T-34]